MTRLRIDAPWAASVGSAWLWGLGFFFSMHVVLTYGLLGFLLFAVPNAVGLGLFGVLLDRRPDLAAWWSRARTRYAGFFLLYQVAAVAITLFAAGAGFWQPVFGVGAVGAVAILALVGCLIGHVAGLSGLRRWHPPLLALGVAAALVAVFSLASGPALPQVPHRAGIDVRYVGLMLPTLIGFLLGPWLDIQHWQRAVAIRAAGRSVARTYIVGASIFFGLLCVNATLAVTAGLVAVRVPLDGVPEGIAAVATAARGHALALTAFAVWVAIAMLSTLDSFYVATRETLRILVDRSTNPLLGLIPRGLTTSPFVFVAPALALAAAGLGHDAPMMAYLVPFATLLVGAAACLAVETVFGERRYDPIVCLGVGVLATVPFAAGYYLEGPAIVWLGSAFALAPVLQLGRSVPEVQVAAEPAEAVGALAYSGAAGGEAHAVRSGSYGFSDDGWFFMGYMPTYDDTNSVGNVYFANYGRFVGKCRELFFLACMPEFDLKTTSFFILTNDYHHKFRREVTEFEPIVVRLRIEKYNRRFVTLEHEILTAEGGVVGKGSQQLMFVAREDYRLLDIPAAVMTAFFPHFQRASNSNRPGAAAAVA